MTLRIRPIYNLYAYFHNLGLEVVPYSYENVSECPYIACTCVDELSTGVVVNFFFFTMLPPDMARIAIRVLGQCQKHGALLADDIAKWGFARFFLSTLFQKPNCTPRRSLRSPLRTHLIPHMPDEESTC
jgi:hypothetical protein